MTSETLELGPDERLVAKYAFPGGSALGKEAVLTTKRLVLVTGSKRETHPLNRIRAVRVETGRNSIAFILLSACAGVGLAAPLMVGFIAQSIPTSSAAAVAENMKQGYIFAAAGAAFGVACLWGAWLAYKGYTRLAVDLESGTKTYAVQSRDPALLQFVTRVEHAL
jgi:hypothetical protein